MNLNPSPPPQSFSSLGPLGEAITHSCPRKLPDPSSSGLLSLPGRHFFSLLTFPGAPPPPCIPPPTLLLILLRPPIKSISTCVLFLPTFLSVAFKASYFQVGSSSLFSALPSPPDTAPLTVALTSSHLAGALSLKISPCFKFNNPSCFSPNPTTSSFLEARLGCS